MPKRNDPKEDTPMVSTEGGLDSDSDDYPVSVEIAMFDLQSTHNFTGMR